jgi:CheY-like chemotaxis protein
MLVKAAFEESHLANNLEMVSDGEELMDRLLGKGGFAGTERPDILLLDLNMPKKDGREALIEIKAHPVLHRMPVVILTTSSAEEDIVSSYDLGVSSYIRKPVTFEKLIEVVRTLGKYWFEIVELPPRES